MVKKQALAVSLEEFGLSRYEARAYVTLISKGTVSAGELAYYAEIPRPKVYPTLLKLEKKRLATLSKSKPIMCTAASPENAFDDAVHEQIDRVNAMNSLVSSLKQVSEDGKRSRGAEEKRYFQIAAGGVPDRLGHMIEGSKGSMFAVVDQWGMGLLAECREQLITVARRGLEIRVVIPAGQLGSEPFKKIPDRVRVRVAEGGGQNCFIFDGTELLFVDGEGGRGAAFSSADVLGAGQVRSFNQAWRAGLKTEAVADMTRTEAQEIHKIIRIVTDGGLGHVLSTAYTGRGGGPAIMGLLEKNGISLVDRTLDDVIEIVDSALQTTCSGRADLDTKNRNVSIESKLNSGHSLPWAGIVDEYLQGQGYKTRMVYQNDNQRGERIHIKIQR